FPLQPYGGPGGGDFAWTVVVPSAAAVAVFVVMELAGWSKRAADTRPFLLTAVAGLAVRRGRLAFAVWTGPPRPTGYLVGRDGVRRAVRLGRDALALDARAAPAVQGARVEHLARQLPRRPDLSGAVPRRRRRPCRRAPSRLRPDAGDRGPGRGCVRGDAA